MAAPWVMTTGRMDFRMPMADPALDRLRLAQLLSPAFPIGSFSHSQGLEAAISGGKVFDEASALDWVRAILTHSAARIDGLFLALARRPGADPGALAALYWAYLPSRGRALEAAELGRGFRALTGPDAPDLPYPLAVAHATRDMTLPEAEVLALWFQALAAQLISVAVRFMPLGQVAGQRILTGLGPTILGLADDIGHLDQADLGGFAFGADLAAMAQETLEVRIYRS